MLQVTIERLNGDLEQRPSEETLVKIKQKDLLHEEKRVPTCLILQTILAIGVHEKEKHRRQSASHYMYGKTQSLQNPPLLVRESNRTDPWI
ncbi:hypothetical protein EAF00_003238 [Botryotinia globosa]|nr:hypothetical protein EAF00_003238 [Botryotinia globosa]